MQFDLVFVSINLVHVLIFDLQFNGDRLSFLCGKSAKDDYFDSSHHSHGVRADNVGVASEYAQHLIVFWVSAEIFDPDVPVSDSDVDFIFLAMNSSDEFFVNLIEVRCFFVFEIEGAYITRDGSEEDFLWSDF